MSDAPRDEKRDRPAPRLFATAAKGTEGALRDELRELKFRGVRADRGGVHFGGDLVEGYRACLELRIAARVLFQLDAFDAPSGDALYEGVRNIPWEDWMSPRQTLAVRATCRSSALTHTQFIAQRTKDAIVDPIPRADRGASERRPPRSRRLHFRSPREGSRDGLPRPRRRGAPPARLPDPRRGRASQGDARVGDPPPGRLGSRAAADRSDVRVGHDRHRGRALGAPDRAGPRAGALRLRALGELRRRGEGQDARAPPGRARPGQARRAGDRGVRHRRRGARRGRRQRAPLGPVARVSPRRRPRPRARRAPRSRRHEPSRTASASTPIGISIRRWRGVSRASPVIESRSSPTGRRSSARSDSGPRRATRSTTATSRAVSSRTTCPDADSLGRWHRLGSSPRFSARAWSSRRPSGSARRVED